MAPTSPGASPGPNAALTGKPGPSNPACSPIQNYAPIGDCRSIALVSRDGSIDWLCWPRFDSPALFAAILDPSKGGHWRIRPSTPYRTERRYVEHTNVLQTTFTTSEGTAVLTDLMPVSSEAVKRTTLLCDHEIIRELKCTAGEVSVEIDFYPRRHYGKDDLTIRDSGKLGLRMENGRGVLWLRSTRALKSDGHRIRTELRIRAGEVLQFSLSYSEQAPSVIPPLGDLTHHRIRDSVLWWQHWVRNANYDGEYRETILRSALTLKLLTYAPSGAVLAAPTTSLPERVGGSLNWDYRYCWLRDASLTVRGMTGLGFDAETDAFMNWLLMATRLTQPELRILYTIYGEKSPRERELNYLSGFCDSRPVRVGNAARDQLQLDVYGEVIDAAAQYVFHGGEFDRVMRKALVGMGNYLVNNWDRPDQGIWEPREPPKNHTHSRTLCWTAFDRLYNLAKDGHLPGAPKEKYAEERDKIMKQIKREAWNSKRQAYASTYSGSAMDASLLLMSYYGFEEAKSERMQSTYRSVLHDLRAPNDLLYRYQTNPPEGAFGICSFWEVDFLALGGGTLQQAKQLFEHLLTFQNDVGLYAEEIDPHNGGAIGNFPQAFTHVGLISAAISISERERGEEQLAHRSPDAEKAKQEVHS